MLSRYSGGDMRIVLLPWMLLPFVLLVCIWTVHTAPSDERWLSTSLIIVLSFFLTAVFAGMQMAAPKQHPEAPRRQSESVSALGYASGVLFFAGGIAALASLVLPTLFTYGEEGEGLAGDVGLALARISSALFPVVAKYETALQLDGQQLFRAQTVMGSSLLFSLLSGCLLAAAIAIGRRTEGHATEGTPSLEFGPGMFFAFVFWLLITAWAYFGWGEFDGFLTSAKGCTNEATCYLNESDLTLFGAAIQKSLMIAIFPILCLSLVLGYKQSKAV